MTELTEEQAAYVSSIRQACHAINVIAGNVLGALNRLRMALRTDAWGRLL